MDLKLVEKIKEWGRCLPELNAWYLSFSPLSLMSEILVWKLNYEIRDYGVLFYNNRTSYLLPLTSDKKLYVKWLLEVMKEKRERIDCVPNWCAEYMKSKWICSVNLTDKDFINSTKEMIEMRWKKFRTIRYYIGKLLQKNNTEIVEINEKNKNLFLECNAERYRKKQDTVFRLYFRKEIECSINNYEMLKEHFNVKWLWVYSEWKIIWFVFGDVICDNCWWCVFHRRSDFDEPWLWHYMHHILAKEYETYELENYWWATISWLKSLKTRIWVGMLNSFTLLRN